MQGMIKEILELGKCSKADIARCVGASKETIRRIMVGKTKKPTRKTANSILYLYISLTQGIEDHGQKNNQNDKHKEVKNENKRTPGNYGK